MDKTKSPYEEKRPWGSFTTFFQNDSLTIKILRVEKNQAFSLQKHTGRDEQWHIISGKGIVTVGDENFIVNKGDNYYIPRTTLHRIESKEEEIVALEISFGDFNEEDIIRIEDRYGRS